jgi:hypothetical protein
METPTAQQLYYSEIVLVDLAPNTVNFADDILHGHRVQVSIAADDLNTFFQWSRPADQDRPVGFCTHISDLEDCLFVSFSDGFLDLDAISTGLCYTTGTLSTEPTSIPSMNDIVLCYILYKVYGKSSYDTHYTVFNVEDAFEMIDSMTVSLSICNSISNHNERGQSIDEMFRDLLKSDPNRFFDSEGHQIPGLFEIHTDESATGSWNFTPGDCIEISVRFTFQEPVTRRVVPADQLSLTKGDIQFIEQATEQIIIPKDSTFTIRLQLLATEERSPARIYQLVNGGTVNFRPTAPTSIILSQTTRARELTVSYSSGNSYGLPILGNHIRVYDETNELIYDIFNTTLVRGLETKPYTVTVAERNVTGEGAESERSSPCIPITTVADPPTNLELIQTGIHDQLQLTWTAPLYDGGSEILGYHIFVFDSEGTKVQDFTTSLSPITIESLVSTEFYTVNISTQTSNGESILSEASISISPDSPY